MKKLLILALLISVIAIGVSEVSASSDICSAGLDASSPDGVDLNHGFDISKHYHPEYTNIFMKDMSHLFSDISNMISGLFN